MKSETCFRKECEILKIEVLRKNWHFIQVKYFSRENTKHIPLISDFNRK